MNFRTTLVLLVLVIVAGVTAIVLHIKFPGGMEGIKDREKQVFRDFDAEKATKLERKVDLANLTGLNHLNCLNTLLQGQKK